MSAAAPRPAASILLLRDGSDGLEVLLARRSDHGDFPGLHVFPGGLVDAGDRDAALHVHATLPEEAATALLPGVELPQAWLLAGIREAFEECGVLLAGRLPPAAELREARRRLLARECSFAQLVAGAGIRPDTAALGLFSHWVTPEGIPRRYDTRFFVAAMPPGQEAAADGREAVSLDWYTPAAALAAHERGEIRLIFPTIRNLMLLGNWRDSAAVLEDCRRPRAVPVMLPRMVPGPAGVRLLLPGDAGYDDVP